MYALQETLRPRAPEWLKIGGEPEPTELCWYWNWEDIGQILDKIRLGIPFVIGPNVIFAWSGNPGGGHGEREILDAPTCRAIMCHSQWYEALIREHLGPNNSAAIVRWPYPILPLPDGPKDDHHDVFIYDKMGGVPPILEEALGHRFPHATTIRYGHYQRRDLYELARRSRACVYLCTDESGPLAMAEILLAGCPAIGIERGAPFVLSGRTGVRVEDFTPSSILEGVEKCHAMDRNGVREIALKMFDAGRIADAVINALDYARKFDGKEAAQIRRLAPPGYPIEACIARGLF
jgi:hypothetical protein